MRDSGRSFLRQVSEITSLRQCTGPRRNPNSPRSTTRQCNRVGDSDTSSSTHAPTHRVPAPPSRSAKTPCPDLRMNPSPASPPCPPPCHPPPPTPPPPPP